MSIMKKLGQENEGQGPRSNTNMQQFDTVMFLM